MKPILLAVLLGFCASHSLAYRFICNGMLANGTERTDECGVCDDDSAARWREATIEVVVDKDILPKGLSRSQWDRVVNNSFAAWEQVSGSRLRFVEKNQKNPRQFGANDQVHEIFWITNRQEWRKLVGSGEFGTLGATLPRYVCGSEYEHRVIFDGDLVLNGLGHINWQLECQNDDCISPQTTLVHELGHLFGLDHPCLLCSSSIMSARAGFDLTFPVYDDMEGLRVLYPDYDKGGFLSSCTSDKDCRFKGFCLKDGENHYCSRTCENNDQCEQGTLCQEIDSKKACAFLDDDTAGGRGEGDSCLNKPCSDPFICAGASDFNYFCYKPCGALSDCSSDQDCVKLQDNLSLCVTVKGVGEACDHRNLCDRDLFCVFETLSTGTCRAQCQKIGIEPRCPHPQICHSFNEGADLCMPAEAALNLGDYQDGFGLEQSPENKKKESYKSGCYTGHSNEGNLFGLYVLFFLYLMKKWPYSLLLKRH